METARVDEISSIVASSSDRIVLLTLTRLLRHRRWVSAGKSGGRDSKKGVLPARLVLCDFFSSSRM